MISTLSLISEIANILFIVLLLYSYFRKSYNENLYFAIVICGLVLTLSSLFIFIAYPSFRGLLYLLLDAAVTYFAYKNYLMVRVPKVKYKYVKPKKPAKKKAVKKDKKKNDSNIIEFRKKQ